MGIVFGCLLRIVTVDGIELHSPLTTPFDSLIKEFALSDAPENQLVLISDEHLQGVYCKRSFHTYSGIFMGDNGTVKIYCDSQG